jgi:tol-pal system protein YbgF
MALAATACGARPPRSSTSSSGSGSGASSERELQLAVERLRLERRLRERKIRDLENQLATSGQNPGASSASAGSGELPSLPVQVLSPAAGRATPSTTNSADEVSSLSRASRSARAGGAADDDELPGELTAQGERVIGLADDGSEIVYIDDAATGRVVSPSAEALAEVGRPGRRSAIAPAPAGLDGPAIEEGESRALLNDDDEGDSLHDRLPPLPTPLASIARRAARTRAQPTRVTVAPSAPSIAPAIAPARPASPQPSVRGSEGGTAELAYREALAKIRRAEYEGGIASLRDFLQRYPRHDYADNAQYWLGEAFYAQRQYGQALAELRLVVERYPQGNKVPDALLKVGYCHLAMGEREKSENVLREVIRLFPRSEPALLAAKKLEEGK